MKRFISGASIFQLERLHWWGEWTQQYDRMFNWNKTYLWYILMIAVRSDSSYLNMSINVAAPAWNTLINKSTAWVTNVDLSSFCLKFLVKKRRNSKNKALKVMPLHLVMLSKYSASIPSLLLIPLIFLE